MKKIIALLIAAIVLVSTSGLAEFDLTGMSESELKDLQKAITDELANRRHQSDPSPDLDFLSDEARRDQYKSDVENIKLENVRSAVEQYMSKNDPAENDTAFAVLDALTTAEEDITVFDVQVDAFDGTVIATYPGLESLSEDVCIVPVTKSDEWGSFKIGYVSDEWVFFDRIAMSMNGEIIFDREYESGEIEDDVDGGFVSEWVNSGIYVEGLEDEEFLKDNTFAIRFFNTSKDVHYDHVLSQQEKEGIYYCWRFGRDMNALYRIWSDYDTMLLYKRLGK